MACLKGKGSSPAGSTENILVKGEIKRKIEKAGDSPALLQYIILLSVSKWAFQHDFRRQDCSQRLVPVSTKVQVKTLAVGTKQKSSPALEALVDITLIK